MTDRELMKLALESLDWAAGCIEPRKPINCDCPVCFASNALRERLAQPELTLQEAAVTRERSCAECGKSGGWALYCVGCVEKMARREWVGLTEAERVAIAEACGAMDAGWLVFLQAVEKALKEKNA